MKKLLTKRIVSVITAALLFILPAASVIAGENDVIDPSSQTGVFIYLGPHSTISFIL